MLGNIACSLLHAFIRTKQRMCTGSEYFKETSLRCETKNTTVQHAHSHRWFCFQNLIQYFRILWSCSIVFIDNNKQRSGWPNGCISYNKNARTNGTSSPLLGAVLLHCLCCSTHDTSIAPLLGHQLRQPSWRVEPRRPQSRQPVVSQHRTLARTGPWLCPWYPESTFPTASRTPVLLHLQWGAPWSLLSCVLCSTYPSMCRAPPRQTSWWASVRSMDLPVLAAFRWWPTRCRTRAAMPAQQWFCFHYQIKCVWGALIQNWPRTSTSGGKRYAHVRNFNCTRTCIRSHMHKPYPG